MDRVPSPVYSFVFGGWAMGQSVSVSSVDESINAGNIQSRTEYAYTNGTLGSPTGSITYTYNTNIWRDMLRFYGTDEIRYDLSGNPLMIGDWRLAWKHGRQLDTLNTGTATWSFTYGADGLRTKRTDGTITYTYVYNGSKLTAMTKGTDKLYFTYDASGVPLTVVHNNVTYYYKTNLQGDVIGIVNSSGTAVVTYAYNAWGKLLVCTDTTTSSLGTLNPLRYRGYVYDTETALYYLQSRYYNPEWGRFINPDAYVATGQGFVGNNMFAYCLNNPTNLYDINGCFSLSALLTAKTSVLIADFLVKTVPALVSAALPVVAAAAAVTVVVVVVVVIVEESKPVPAPAPQKENNKIPVIYNTQNKEKENRKDIVIYRWAKRRNTNPRDYENLTPRKIDTDGLSFSLVPATNKGNAVTTVGTLEEAGFTCIINGNHVAVIPPGGMPALTSWINSYENASENPHYFTQLLYSLTW